MKREKIWLLFFSMILIISITPYTSHGKYMIDRSITVATLNIDRTKPVGVVSYSSQKSINTDVLVTVNLSEPICEVEGWNLSEDKLTLTKTYNQNANDTLAIVDLSGNESIVKIDIKNS